MAKKRPKYCGPHNPSGLGYVWVDGRQIYFKGYPHGSPESWNMYQRFIRKWDEEQNREPEPIDLAGNPLIAELALAFMDWVKVEYKDSVSEPIHFRQVVELLVQHFGTMRARDFGPRSLTKLRDRMVELRRDDGESQWNRTTINQHIQRVRRLFKWAVSLEYVPSSVWYGLQAVEGLKMGRANVREKREVGPAPLADVEAAIRVLPPTVATMLRLQLRTGMRSDNVCQMTPGDIDTSGKIWMYTPKRHKSQAKGKALVIPLGPATQEAIQPFMERERNTFMFSPRESALWTSQQRRLKATRPIRPSRQDAQPKVNYRVRDHYDSGTYRNAVKRGCDKAGVPAFKPHQLRHNCVTLVAESFGIETAQAYVGHATADVTAIYAERSLRVAIEVAQKLG